MNTQIGWFNGRWQQLDELKIPINDRGVSFGDGIFETILIWNQSPQLVSQHLERWRNSSVKLGMETPPKEEKIMKLIHEGLEHCSLDNGKGAIRLNWSRGRNQNRGINLPSQQLNFSSHRFWLEMYSNKPSFSRISTLISCNEKRNADSSLSSHKTFGYSQAIQSRNEAKKQGYDDALLQSTNGAICCGSTSNLIIKRDNQLLTPSLKSGCLPGIMRQQGINLGILKEAELSTSPNKNDEWLLINSLGCQSIYKVNDYELNTFTNTQDFWLLLYGLK
ncbi:aminotransferase class IV [Prochlorococcus sp. MIT 1223]|uniref:aminotransferase class IV n=1 Tax=Prochlorococcus sp. MIT 1223 TaxID=3096217 RepID=UPI002A751129|nr:aminotransferase class IV [Prochlorococcus sp. MIT 1223]